jgi:2-oxoglutarate ferredoxin oxidoreductase subunit alpha
MVYTIKIGGEAGQGVQTIGDTLGKVFSRSGFQVFSHQDYESRIRGGHNFYQISFSDKHISASRDEIDILVALNKESVLRHEKELSQYGQVVYDSKIVKQKYDKPYFLNVPFIDFAAAVSGDKLMANSAATGAVLGMLGMKLDILNGIIEETFKKKGEEIIKANKDTAMAGYDYAQKKCLKCSFSLPPPKNPFMLIGGNEAIALGALASGLKFYSAYPMTPSTGIMNYLASKAKEYGVIIEQAEDEISAINMAIGASFAGVRAMTGTSGGGFALMSEGLSLAGMTETPIVIALAQRPGPATGLPTRTEQGDLQFALYTSHGEFARIIFAPGTPEQAFYLTNKAFDLSEKYQVPVIILTDQYLADSQWTYEKFEMSKLRYAYYRLRGEKLNGISNYNRHLLAENGVSAFAVPGESRHLVVTDSDEHDEEGHITEDPVIRNEMVNKRLDKKLTFIRREIAPPILYGAEKPDIVLSGWGSTYGVMKEAVAALSSQIKISMLHFSEIYPFPDSIESGYLEFLNKASLTISVENNATGQFARLMRTETGFKFSMSISKFDGRPFSVGELVERIKSAIK